MFVDVFRPLVDYVAKMFSGTVPSGTYEYL